MRIMPTHEMSLLLPRPHQPTGITLVFEGRWFWIGRITFFRNPSRCRSPLRRWLLFVFGRNYPGFVPLSHSQRRIYSWGFDLWGRMVERNALVWEHVKDLSHHLTCCFLFHSLGFVYVSLYLLESFIGSSSSTLLSNCSVSFYFLPLCF